MGSERQEEGETRTCQGTCNRAEVRVYEGVPCDHLSHSPPRMEDLEGAGRTISVSVCVAWACMLYVCWYPR